MVAAKHDSLAVVRSLFHDRLLTQGHQFLDVFVQNEQSHILSFEHLLENVKLHQEGVSNLSLLEDHGHLHHNGLGLPDIQSLEAPSSTLCPIV